MICRDDQLQFVFVQHHAVQPRLARWQIADADIQRAIEQASLDFDAGQFVNLYHQMRLGLTHPLKHLWYQAGVHGLQYPNGNGAQRLALKVVQGLFGPLQTVEQWQCMVIQGVRRQGRQQAFAAALEKADIEVVLELTNLLRQGWLRDGKAFGSTAHMAFFIDRDEITQLLEIHK